VDFLGEMRDFLHSGALLPFIPPTPFSHKVEKGELGVLMPETGDGAQSFQKTCPCEDARTPWQTL